MTFEDKAPVIEHSCIHVEEVCEKRISCEECNRIAQRDADRLFYQAQLEQLAGVKDEELVKDVFNLLLSAQGSILPEHHPNILAHNIVSQLSVHYHAQLKEAVEKAYEWMLARLRLCYRKTPKESMETTEELIKDLEDKLNDR